MRNVYLALLFFSFSFSFGCTMPEDQNDKKIVESKKHERKDPFHQLCQYWEVTDADNPTFRDLFDNHTEGIYDFPGIIFMTDSTFLENPRAAMRYGKFVLKGKTIDAQFDDGKKAVYTIQNIEGTKMILRRAEKGQSTILNLKESKVFWPNAQLNPFNKMNSAWRIKPSKKETPAELNERLKECVRFYEYFFQGYSESESDEIDFLGLPSCFKWYQGGIYVQGPKNLDKKWINCFYDEEQAFQARQMMEDVVLKKYDWDTTEKNWLKQTADVLKQMYDKM